MLFKCGVHAYTQKHTQPYRIHTQLYPLGEGARELYEVPLILVIIVHSERMSRSEPRKPLNFPQRNEKEGVSEISEKREEEDRWRERKEWQNVCQMRKGGKMKSVIRFPGGTSPTFKEPFRSSCTSVFLFKPSSSSNKQQTLSESRSLLQQQPEVSFWVFLVFHMTKGFEFSGPEINPSRCQPLCARVCRDTCNEQIWCWFQGAAFALISACLQAFLSPAASA